MKMSSDERCAWLALCLIPGLGNTVIKRLLGVFGHPEDIFKAGLSELRSVEGVRRDVAHEILKRRFAPDAEKELREVERLNARIITFADPSYPKLLREIDPPPMLLYIKGKDMPLDKTFVAVVGSRNPTHYGIKAAQKIGMGLARRGAGVVSGLARGIDSASHIGCLRGGGFTIAVLGTGIDRIYPAMNKRLSEEIAEDGAVISEFPMGTPPEPKNFPIRNRIISGLSRGVAVVEATKKSGSLITASCALDQGREVFAVPGSIDSFKSTGTHFLIKQGAKLVENADDILEEFGFRDKGIYEGGDFGAPSVTPMDMDESEKKIYDIIGDYPIHIDQIVRMGEIEPGQVSSILMKMELMGMVQQLPGKMFVR
jgi:DNA processing protein